MEEGWLIQEEAGRILGMSERTFRRYVRRVEEEGVKEIPDKRLTALLQFMATVFLFPLSDSGAFKGGHHFSVWTSLILLHTFFRREDHPAWEDHLCDN